MRLLWCHCCGLELYFTSNTFSFILWSLCLPLWCRDWCKTSRLSTTARRCSSFLPASFQYLWSDGSPLDGKGNPHLDFHSVAFKHRPLILIVVDIFTIYVAETNDLQEHQEQHNPAGSKLVNQSHPVDSGLDQTPAQTWKGCWNTTKLTVLF